MRNAWARMGAVLAGLGLALACVTAGALAGPLEVPGLVSYWRADGTTADSADSNPGTLVGGATYAVGTYGRAFDFDGSNDYVRVGDRANLVVTNELTVGAWIYPTGPGSTNPYGGILVNKEGEYEIARFTNGTIQVALANSTPGWNWINTGVVAPLNTWTHVTVAYDNGTVQAYANGTPTAPYSGAGAIGDQDPTRNEFWVGARQYGGQRFDGRIDEVAVYGRALGGAEVQELLSSGPVSIWRADGDATDAYDGNHGTLVGGVSYAAGKYGQAFSFDGTNGRVAVSDPESLVMTDEFTAAAWIYPTGAGIIVNREGEYEIARFGDGSIQWAIKNSNPGWNWRSTGLTAPLNTWSHVAVTYDHGTVTGYLNGTAGTPYAGAGTIGDLSPTMNNFWIGGREALSQYYRGLIDEVKMYNRALSEDEILALLLPAPVADPGGPYMSPWATMVELDGSGSFDPAGGAITAWMWDLDDDGIFGEAGELGQTVQLAIPPYGTPGWEYLSSHPIRLKVGVGADGRWSDVVTTELVAAPEPATALLVLGGLAAVLRRRRR